MSATSKRKQTTFGGDRSHLAKRSKGGHGTGSWQTPHQKAKFASLQDRDAKLDVGDAGIWVTFARGMDGKAIREFHQLCHEYGRTLYSIDPPCDDDLNSCEYEAEDVETLIKKELDDMCTFTAKRTTRHFKVIRAGIECVFFMKTKAPVDPVELSRRICQDALACADLRDRKTKYVNRLTPQQEPLRHGSILGEAHILRQVYQQHRLNLCYSAVVLVDIFQSYCGISVIDGSGDWDGLKKMNVNELYKLPPSAGPTLPT
ncbi:tRNA acetyltransferase TAN1 [Colletotrichum orbiculare MAFF 240422]|uniref:tRNA acetyltransferase TAN1 n=1 Tax=Colletotrichum orbiculare (strain 104-T / ATCC 96160 / CBS 514.97 / LARS 414 / MAFF 240422) TaxID=1213857 RepID=A0A484G5D1_COLOR|nr:tRNA acetyltransferase TAN1 [Colletotrichum orbiculare MAFF 240422]